MPALQEFHDSTLYLIRAETAVNTTASAIWSEYEKKTARNIVTQNQCEYQIKSGNKNNQYKFDLV